MKEIIRNLALLNIYPSIEARLYDIGWLICRLIFSGFMFMHGYPKLIGFSKMAPHFPDPLGIGQSISLGLTVGSEFFGALFVAFGLLTRWSALTITFTMFVAAFVVHGADPWQKQELAVLYGVVFLIFVFSGGGKYSLDTLLKKK